MLLLSIVYDENKDDFINDIAAIKDGFKRIGVNMGVCESIVDNHQLVKIFCDDEDFNENVLQSLNMQIAEILYKKMVGRFYDTILEDFLSETYFFLKYEEIMDIKYECMQALKCNGEYTDENMIYYTNRKNSAIKKITKCIEENMDINIKGFMTFRMAEIKEDLTAIVDKVIEKYMVEKEYNEFIKLLKYFVDIQESKMELLNIIIKEDGNYIIKDDKDNEVMDKFIEEVTDSNSKGEVNVEDLIISGLITNSPKKIVIHCVENCKNKEFIQTIKKVFEERVSICEKCSLCENINHMVKI